MAFGRGNASAKSLQANLSHDVYGLLRTDGAAGAFVSAVHSSPSVLFLSNSIVYTAKVINSN